MKPSFYYEFPTQENHRHKWGQAKDRWMHERRTEFWAEDFVRISLTPPTRPESWSLHPITWDVVPCTEVTSVLFGKSLLKFKRRFGDRKHFNRRREPSGLSTTASKPALQNLVCNVTTTIQIVVRTDCTCFQYVTQLGTHESEKFVIKGSIYNNNSRKTNTAKLNKI